MTIKKNLTNLGLTTIFSVFVLGASAALAGGSHNSGHGGASPIGSPGKASEAKRSIEITMYDNYFEPKELSTKPGETVRFVIKNAGEFVHEFNIGTPTMHGEHQKEMMMMMEHGALEADKIHHDKMKMDMGGGKTMQHNDPNSVLLEPGKSGEVIWKFAQADGIEFACNVPGHYDAGMVGVLAVHH
jgi:uncharacterized cupredoxin-like copper-binding protein